LPTIRTWLQIGDVAPPTIKTMAASPTDLDKFMLSPA
jgi:hypothetical protein